MLTNNVNINLPSSDTKYSVGDVVRIGSWPCLLCNVGYDSAKNMSTVVAVDVTDGRRITNTVAVKDINELTADEMEKIAGDNEVAPLGRFNIKDN